MGSLILVRHSTTAASVAGRNLGRNEDPPLAPDGVARAVRLADTLTSELAELPHDELRMLRRRCRSPQRWACKGATWSSTNA